MTKQAKQAATQAAKTETQSAKVEVQGKPAETQAPAAEARAPEAVEGNLAGAVTHDDQIVALADMPDDVLNSLATDMGIDIAGKTKADIAAAIAAEPVTFDATEGKDVAGVIETREDNPAPGVQIDGQGLELPEGDLQLHLVQWDIKFKGSRYTPGSDVAMMPDEAAPFLASGALKRAPSLADFCAELVKD